MAPAMIEHTVCGRTHRNEAAVERCERLIANRAAREERRILDQERRAANQEREPPADYVRRRYGREGIQWYKVASELKKDYPPPTGDEPWNMLGRTEWTVITAVMIDNQRLKWGV